MQQEARANSISPGPYYLITISPIAERLLQIAPAI